MFNCFTFQSLGLVSLLALLPCTATQAASIVDRSPFLPPGFSPPSENRQPQRKPPSRSNHQGFEFRGMYELDGETFLLISEARTRKGHWVNVGASNEHFEVRDFDPDSRVVTLFFDDRVESLRLAELADNPTPSPVRGNPNVRPGQPHARVTNAASPAAQPPRPASRAQTPRPSTPDWLQKIREEARARAADRASAGAGGVVNPTTGRPDTAAMGGQGSSGPPNFTPPPVPPDFATPPPPPNISIEDIPPPPTEPPPPPPAELLNQIRQSMNLTPAP